MAAVLLCRPSTTSTGCTTTWERTAPRKTGLAREDENSMQIVPSFDLFKHVQAFVDSSTIGYSVLSMNYYQPLPLSIISHHKHPIFCKFAQCAGILNLYVLCLRCALGPSDSKALILEHNLLVKPRCKTQGFLEFYPTYTNMYYP